MIIMILKEKERTVIQDLQTQEKSCIEKYGKYAQQARDPELKSLFQTLQKKEQEHYDSLSQVLSGTVPQVNCNDSDGRDYQPKAAYTSVMSSEDKEHDAFLATDCIGTEKLIPENTIRRFLLLKTVVCGSFWLISRWKSRIMRRCFTNIRL